MQANEVDQPVSRVEDLQTVTSARGTSQGGDSVFQATATGRTVAAVVFPSIGLALRPRHGIGRTSLQGRSVWFS